MKATTFGRSLRIVCLGILSQVFVTAASRAQAEAPEIALPPESRVVMAGQGVTFSVQASGTEPLSYQWLKNGTILNGATGHLYSIDSASTNDAGDYAVRVSNVAGTVTSANARLSVIPPQPGSLDYGFGVGLGANDVVKVIVPTGNGQILIGGYFTTVHGVSRNRIARLNADGSLDLSFDPGTGANSVVGDIAVQADGRIIIAGAFTSFDGTNCSRVARLMPDGTLDSTFGFTNQLDGAVWALALDPPTSSTDAPGFWVEQRVIAGGDFALVSDVHTNLVGGTNPPSSVVRINSNGVLDETFLPAVTGSVRALAFDSGGWLLVGGSYLNTGIGSSRTLIRLAPDGSVDTAFDPGFPTGSWVFDVLLEEGGKILVGGDFFQVGAIPRRGIARLTGDGLVDAEFNRGAGAAGTVTSIARQSDGKIIVGGGFTSFDGVACENLIRLDANGAADPGFQASPGPNGWVESVAVQTDGSILLGGSFTSIGGMWRSRFARLRGGEPILFAPVIVEQPLSRVVSEGSDPVFAVVASGYPRPAFQWHFGSTPIPGATQDRLALRNVRPEAAGLYQVTVSNERGSVVSVPATLAINRVAPRPGGPDISFYPGTGPDKKVTCLAIQNDGGLLVGGYFGSVDGFARTRVARLSANGSVDPGFTPPTGLSNGWVNTIALLNNGQIMVGGAFYYSGFPSVNHAVVRLNPDGSQDPAFSLAGVNYAAIYALLPLSDGSTLAGGSLGLQGWPYSAGIIRVDSFGQIITNFVCRIDSGATVYGMALQPDGHVVLAGDFTEVNGIYRKGVARIDSNGAVDLTFDPRAGANSPLRAVAVQADGRILVAGNFTRFGGQLCSRIARLESNGLLDRSFEAGLGPDYAVNAIAVQSDGKILVAGSFIDISGRGNSGIARLNRDGSLDLSFESPPGANGEVRAVGIDSLGGTVIAGDFTEVGGVPRARITRLWPAYTSIAAPRIVAGPESQVIQAGADATFSVFASGDPLPSCQWYLNNREIPGASNWFFRVPNVRVTNAGLYSVIVSNALGQAASSMAYLWVTPPDLSAGAPDIDFYPGLGPSDPVRSVVVQRDGRILIAGEFSEVNGIVSPGLARLFADGQVDPSLAPALQFTDEVNALAVQPDGRIVVGGSFLRENIQRPVLRLLADGGHDPDFNLPLGIRGDAYALALQPDGKVLLGGVIYTNYTSVTIRLLRLNSNGSLDDDFRFTGQLFYGAVECLAVQTDGKILVGGGFLASPYPAAGHILRLFGNGSLDYGFVMNQSPPNGAVTAIAIEGDGSILIGGEFSYVGGVNRNGVARLTSSGQVDPGFEPPPLHSRLVNAVLSQGDGKVLIGGGFRSIAGRPVNRIARLNRHGSLDLTFDPGLGATDGSSFLDDYDNFVDGTQVLSIALDGDGKIVVAGDFGRMDGIPRNNLARLFGHDPSERIEMRAVLTQDGPKIELRWEAGVLQQAPALDAGWLDVAGATSPFLVTPSTTQTFYRLRFN